MSRLNKLNSEMRNMKYDGLDAIDIGDFNVNTGDADDIFDIDMKNIMDDAAISAGLDAEFYGNC